MPIRSLSPRHRARIAQHLVALDPHDRYLRFGYVASDSQISRYVDTLDFDRDEVFGIFNRRLELIAMAHLAYSVASAPGQVASAEFGVSVLQRARGRGFGRRLFEHAGLHARNRGVDTLFIQALSENTAMLAIARKAGAHVVREGADANAHLKLPPGSFASHVDEWFERGAAEIDFHMKRRIRDLGDVLEVLDDVRESVGRSTHIAQE